MSRSDDEMGVSMRVILAQPRGFCAGVVRAIEIVERALAKFGAPVYVRHEIVHNRHVVEALKAKGAVFVDEVDAVPPGAVTIFSAHGVPATVEDAAAARRLFAVDATCPLVKKVHHEGRRYAGQGYEIVLVGHEGHPEVVGTLGQIGARVHLVENADDVTRLPLGPDARVAYVTQTTLSVDETRTIAAALRARFPDIVGPDTRDICYATQNRQSAVRELARIVDAVMVVGSANSSNSNRLCEIARDCGVPSRLVEDAGGLDWDWLAGVRTLGITAGASAPEALVEGLIRGLRARTALDVSILDGPVESVEFRLPAEVA
jgi:4-hydroxy-3-methylbut-2-enyl diphosphate reductase